MPLTEEQGIKLHKLDKEAREIRSIMLKIIRTEETDGCFNPYNKGFEYLCEIVSEVRGILKEKLEKNAIY